MATNSEDSESDNEDLVDFISELHKRNCQHIIDNILQNLSPVTILRVSKVCQSWKAIGKHIFSVFSSDPCFYFCLLYLVRESSQFPTDLAQLFHKYHTRNSGYDTEELFDQRHLDNFQVQSHKMYPGGDVKTILVSKNKLFVGLASGLTKLWDLSNYDNLKYPATKYFDPDNGKGVTHLDVNSKYLATGHGNLVLIWSLDSAAILSEAIGKWPHLNFPPFYSLGFHF